MEVNAKRAFELLNKLSFERVSCTAEETRTAEALLAEIDSFTWARSDIQREIEVFKASTGTVTAARLIVTEPYEKEYPVTAYLRSDSTPDDGLELELVYVENALPANLLGVEGKAVLVNGRFGFEAYGRIQKAKPALPATSSIKMTKPITVSVKFAKPTPPNSATTSSLI